MATSSSCCARLGAGVGGTRAGEAQNVGALGRVAGHASVSPVIFQSSGGVMAVSEGQGGTGSLGDLEAWLPVQSHPVNRHEMRFIQGHAGWLGDIPHTFTAF